MKTGRAMKPLDMLTVISLVVAILSFLYTARTFTLTNRAYVGVIEHDYQIYGEPPTAMTWRFVMKNVGTAPTWVTVKAHFGTVIDSTGVARTLPLFGEPMGGIYMMPGQTADLTSQLSDAGGNARVVDILAGRTKLRVEIRLSYDSPSAFGFGRTHKYEATSEFRVNPTPPRFVMTSGQGT
jgi:hypothetical protein